MAATEPPPALRTWSHATFHTVTFVVVTTAMTHAGGSLADALSRLNTVLGFAAFLVLWVLTWFATRAGLSRLMPIEHASTSDIVTQTTIAGGWNGSAIFVALVVYALITGLATRGAQAIAMLPVQIVVAMFGVLLAFVIGGIVGFVYGLIDALVVGCGEWLYRFSSTSTSS